MSLWKLVALIKLYFYPQSKLVLAIGVEDISHGFVVSYNIFTSIN